MRTLLVALILAVPARAADTGKTHEYDRAKLPESVKVKAGDTIVVTEDVPSADVDELQASVEKNLVTVQGDPKAAKFRVVIKTVKKGGESVAWKITTAGGKVIAPKGLKIEVE